MSKITIPIRGMHCRSCELLVEKNLKKIDRVEQVKVNYKIGQAEIHYRGDGALPKTDLDKAIKSAGYEIGEPGQLPWLSKRREDYRDLVKAAIWLTVLYYLAKWLGLLSISVNTNSGGVWVALFVGLVAGVSTCMALVGGLVLGISARHAELHPEATAKQKFRPHWYFNLGRVVGYAFFGGLIGLIGSALKPSATFLGLLTLAVGLVMLLMGLKLIEIFPALKNKSLTLPGSLSRWLGIHKENKEYSHRAAATAGALTFFLPCGFTQAMQIYAVSTGSFAQGALLMGMFALGTSAGLLSLGGLSSAFKGNKARIFFMMVGLAVILLGWYNINNGRALLAGAGGVAIGTTSVDYSAGAQVVNMTQDGSGYHPNVLSVKKGVPVKWIVDSINPYSCASSLVVPSLGISKTLQRGENIIEFTPTATGEIPFSCSMGMYRGKFIVTDSGNSGANGSLPVANSGKSCGGGGGCGGCGGGKRNSIPSIQGAVESGGLLPGEQVLRATYTYSQDIAPNTFTVKANKPVRLVVNVKDNGSGCMSTIMVRNWYENPQFLRAGQTIEMAFTPTTRGQYPITCAMGVPRGVINVE